MVLKLLYHLLLNKHAALFLADALAEAKAHKPFVLLEPCSLCFFNYRQRLFLSQLEW